MSGKYLRLFLFIFAAILTFVLPVLLKDEISKQLWIALFFTVAAEALVLLSSKSVKSTNFPLYLPLFICVYPAYLLLTILLAVFSAAIQWRYMLAIELTAAFFIFASYAIAALASKNEEKK